MEAGKWDGISVGINNVFSKIFFPQIASELDKNLQLHVVSISLVPKPKKQKNTNFQRSTTQYLQRLLLLSPGWRKYSPNKCLQRVVLSATSLLDNKNLA